MNQSTPLLKQRSRKQIMVFVALVLTAIVLFVWAYLELKKQPKNKDGNTIDSDNVNLLVLANWIAVILFLGGFAGLGGYFELNSDIK